MAAEPQGGYGMNDIKDRANAVLNYEEKEADATVKEQNTDPEVGETVQEETGPKRSKAARVGAFIALGILLGLIIWLIVCIITGSKYTLAVLFCVIIYPIILYFMSWLKKVFSA